MSTNKTIAALQIVLAVIIAAVLGALIFATFQHYRGSTLTLATFHISYLLLLGLAFPLPRLYFYTFLAGFLFLGFWPKVVLQTIWEPGFIDPVGGFAGSAAEWDAALWAAISGAAGVMVVRLFHLALAGRIDKTRPITPQQPPDWYSRYRHWVWSGTLILVVVVNGLNFHFSFFQVGVNPKLILPFKLNVPVAWLVNVGFAFWISALVHWERLMPKPAIAGALAAPIMEAFFSSVCALSRLTYLLHTLPYWLAIWEKRTALRGQLAKRNLGFLFATFIFLFVTSIYAVFWLRINIYYYVPPTDSVTTQAHRTMAFQLPHLFVQRWVGLEGTLVVGAAPDRGADRLAEVLMTDPAAGAQSLYQQLAKVHFLSENPDKFTFLANTGIVAILLFSGSLTIVFLGLAFVAALMIVTEICITRLLDNDFFRALAGVSLANVVAQTTFPYLTLIFFLQLCVAIAFLAWLHRLKVSDLRALLRRRGA